MLGTGHPCRSPGAIMALVNFRKVSPRKFYKYKLRPVTHEIGTPTNLTVPTTQSSASICLFEIQRTCVDKILALGECPPKDLKIGEEWGPEVLNLRLFFLFF